MWMAGCSTGWGPVPIHDRMPTKHIPRLGNSAHQRCLREVDTLLWFPVRTHSIITFTSRMAASGHGSVAHRVKLRLMVHMVPGSNPAWDFLSGKREGGLKPPEWLLVHKGPSLSLVPSPGPRGCNCLCLAHVRKCCVLHASHPPSDWYFRTFYIRAKITSAVITLNRIKKQHVNKIKRKTKTEKE